MNSVENLDILIIGGGSAGFGAAYRALRSASGLRVGLVEANPGLGGTSTYGGVNNWEPGIGGAGVHKILAKRLMERGDGFVAKTTEFYSGAHPWALSEPCDDPYESTLLRHGVSPENQRRFQFEPEAMSEVMLELLREADLHESLSLMLSSRLTAVEVENRRISACKIATPNGEIVVRPRLVVDCTGDIVAARMAGCSYLLGEEGESVPTLNGLTLCFKISENCAGIGEKLADYADIDLTDWYKRLEGNGVVSCINAYPRGGFDVNMLPTIDGSALVTMTHEKLVRTCTARVLSYFEYFAPRFGFDGYKIERIFPMLGIREGYRLNGRYVLTSEDLLNGYAKSLGHEHTVAFGDHPMDTHGKGGGLSAVGAYEIPYECMLPREIDNMLVACRGASFSHRAASSARLSRTMLALGEAAGNAAVYCVSRNIAPSNVADSDIRVFMPN